ncbi:MAG: glutamate ligase domain-containing protein, partial [Acidobacteriota bacterium]
FCPLDAVRDWNRVYGRRGFAQYQCVLQIERDPSAVRRFFEVLTAVALLQGRACRVDAAVVEIGLGGRYDATNVLPARVCVITNISLDHTRHLGSSTRQVAWNKAGIIKAGSTVLTAETSPAPLAVIRRQAGSCKGHLIAIPPAAARADPDGTWSFDLKSVRAAAGDRLLGGRLSGVRLKMAGCFQGRNALLGMAAAAALSASGGPAVKRAHLAAGLKAAHLPGRLEIRQAARHRLIILDGAHNPAAAASLAAALKTLLAPGRAMTILFGVLADKDAAGITRPLFPLAARLILCRPRRKRARAPRTLLAYVPPGVEAKVVNDPTRAYRSALLATPAGGTLLVTGSFSLLGDLAASTSRLKHVPSAQLPSLRRRRAMTREQVLAANG